MTKKTNHRSTEIFFPTHPDENVGVSNNYEQSFGTGDGHVEAFWIGQKTKRTLQILAFQWFIRAHLDN